MQGSNLGRARLGRRAKKTVCFVGGPDLGCGREYSVAIGSGFSAGHDLEDLLITSAGNTDAKRQAAGRSLLGRQKIKENLSFKVKQIPGLVYGRDYFFGDKVTAKHLDREVTPEVWAVALEHEVSISSYVSMQNSLEWGCFIFDAGKTRAIYSHINSYIDKNCHIIVTYST